MKSIHKKDPRINRSLFFEAVSICQYSDGGWQLLRLKDKKRRKKEFARLGFTVNIIPEFQHSNN